MNTTPTPIPLSSPDHRSPITDPSHFPRISRQLRAAHRLHRAVSTLTFLLAVINLAVGLTLFLQPQSGVPPQAPWIAVAIAAVAILVSIYASSQSAKAARLHRHYFPSLPLR